VSRTRFVVSRRNFLRITGVGCGSEWLPRWVGSLYAAGGGTLPTNNPVAMYKLSWTDQLRWGNVVSIADFAGDTLAARLEAAQAAVVAKGGGVVYFPAGTYQFQDTVRLKDGVVLRGADPQQSPDAKQAQYELLTKFEFPKYVPKFSETGTPNETAFKGIYTENPLAGNCGLVNLALNRAHVRMETQDDHRTGKNRILCGCILRNAATPDKGVPDAKLGQAGWLRYTARHAAAVTMHTEENVLVANNRLPKSGEDNFNMDGYLLKGPKNAQVKYDGVVFDYDNRPGLYINDYGLGAEGGKGPDGTPESHPYGFRKGIVIRDNYLYHTGRCPISFTGDGTICSFNVIRQEKDVWRPTVTGTSATGGAGTNDNRAIQMRGYRWTVEGNDYEVHSNIAAEKAYKLNDGEGLMHEDHVNSTVVDSKLINNKGNTYLSIYKTGGIDGLLIEGNDIRTRGGIAAIYVVASKNSGPFPCRNVKILNNVTDGGGIQIEGQPAENNLIAGNKHLGGNGKIINKADAKVENNTGYA